MGLEPLQAAEKWVAMATYAKKITTTEKMVKKNMNTGLMRMTSNTMVRARQHTRTMLMIEEKVLLLMTTVPMLVATMLDQ